MHATIDAGGTLHITSESPVEAYALLMWYAENEFQQVEDLLAQGKGGGIVLSYAEEAHGTVRTERVRE